jgi:hypothetical protein
MPQHCGELACPPQGERAWLKYLGLAYWHCMETANCRDLPYCNSPAPVSKYADPDHCNADPHSAFHSDAYPDPPHPAFHFDADLDPDPAHHSESVIGICDYKFTDPPAELQCESPEWASTALF